MADTEFTVDLEKLQKDVDGLSLEDFAESLRKQRITAKKSQLKQTGSPNAKKYQARQREKARLFKDKAMGTPATVKGFANLWEQINAEALEVAKEELADEAVAVTEPDEEE